MPCGLNNNPKLYFTYMKIKTILLALFFLFIFTPPLVLAAPVATTSSLPKLPLIIAKDATTLSEPVSTDVFIAGKAVVIDTTVNGNVYTAGGNLDVKGIINQNLIVAGGTIVISGTVNNLIVAGGDVTIAPQAQVRGYVLAAASKLNINGHLNGPIRLVANNLTINDTAYIAGSLEANIAESSISDKATIVGSKKITIIQNQKDSKPLPSNFSSTLSLVSLVSQLLILLIFVRLIGPHITQFIKPLYDRWFATFGWGFIFLSLTPFAIFLLFLSIIGIPLALILIFIYILNIFLSPIAFSLFFGNWLYSRHYLNTQNIYLQSIVALILFRIVEIIPVLGGLAMALVFFFGLGLLFQFQKGLFRN